MPAGDREDLSRDIENLSVLKIDSRVLIEQKFINLLCILQLGE